MFKKILVPFDGSTCADGALDVAIDMAKKYSSDIILATIQPVPALTIRAALNQEGACAEAQKEQSPAKEKLDKAGIKFTAVTECGDPAEAILKIAKEQQANVIIMGSRGLSGLSELLLGSVSTKVVQLAKVPVLVCKN